MNESQLRTIAQLQEFLDATPDISFTAAAGDGDTQRYEHISRVLRRFDYPQRGKRERGVVLAYLRRTSGYSRPQITRLVARWEENRLATVPLAKRYRAPAAPFARKYTSSDVELLVQMDRANEDVCGPATRHLLKRAHGVYGDARYERLAGLSVSHLLQPAQKHWLPETSRQLHQDATGVQPHWLSQGTTAQWARWLGTH